MNKLLSILLLFVFTNVNGQDPTCPCFGNAFDVLGGCADTVESQNDIACFAAGLGSLNPAGGGAPLGLAFLSCFDTGITSLPELLGSPLFGLVDVFGFGICVNSPNGILGLIRAIFEIIVELIDEFDDCFEADRRRLNSDSNPFHGSVSALEGFLELINCGSSDQCLRIIFREDGIARLAAKMRQIRYGSGGSRRLLDSDDDDDDDFEICDFGFFGEFLPNIFGQFEGEPLEALLGGLFASADCDDPDSIFDFIVCEIIDVVDRRRRLESIESIESGDDDDDEESGDDNGDFPVIAFNLGGAGVGICLDNLNDAENCLSEFADFGCVPGIPDTD